MNVVTTAAPVSSYYECYLWIFRTSFTTAEFVNLAVWLSEFHLNDLLKKLEKKQKTKNKKSLTYICFEKKNREETYVHCLHSDRICRVFNETTPSLLLVVSQLSSPNLLNNPSTMFQRSSPRSFTGHGRLRPQHVGVPWLRCIAEYMCEQKGS